MTLALVIAALVAGFAGSAHCAGMCGPIVSVFETNGHGNGLDWPRRASYQVGRLLTYLTIGALAGVIGIGAVRAGAPTQTALVLRTIAALALLLIGLRLLGGLPGGLAVDDGLWDGLADLAEAHLGPGGLGGDLRHRVVGAVGAVVDDSESDVAHGIGEMGRYVGK